MVNKKKGDCNHWSKKSARGNEDSPAPPLPGLHVSSVWVQPVAGVAGPAPSSHVQNGLPSRGAVGCCVAAHGAQQIQQEAHAEQVAGGLTGQDLKADPGCFTSEREAVSISAVVERVLMKLRAGYALCDWPQARRPGQGTGIVSRLQRVSTES